jgi:hypothetical protein
MNRLVFKNSKTFKSTENRSFSASSLVKESIISESGPRGECEISGTNSTPFYLRRRERFEAPMNNRSKGRKGGLEARQEWTERLNRFVAAKNAKQRQSALEHELKINPGGALRDLLQAWGYSASSRGRKAKDNQGELERIPARQRLEASLAELYGNKPAPVPSLYKKLAGVTPTTVKDACRITAALFSSWPERLELVSDPKSFAQSFLRELLCDLSGGRSLEWSGDDMEGRVFNLVNEVRVGANEFIKDAAENEGALIVASATHILLGPDPIFVLRQFHDLTSYFVSEKKKGLLIFVFDAALFAAGEDSYRLLYNYNLLATAMTAFALFEGRYDFALPIRQYKVDWGRWRALSARCCVVVHRPTVIHPATGEFLKGEKLDEYIASWLPRREFALLGDLQGFVRFDSSHVLPKTYPVGLSHNENLIGRDLYWDVLVRPSVGHGGGLEVQYFTPPIEDTFPISRMRGTRGRPPVPAQPIEEEFIYLIRHNSPGASYDDAQRAIYMAARARLNLDQGRRHLENLNAAAAVRQAGFEVLPVSEMISLFPRSLHFAATSSADASDPNSSNRVNTKAG